MKFSTLALFALVALGGSQSWAQTNKLATVGIVTGTVTITDRVGTPTNRPGMVANNLAGMAYVAGNVPGAVDTSISFFTLTGLTLPPNPGDTFTSYGTLISPTAVGSFPDIAALATANSYSGLTFAIDDLGLPIAGTFYTIHHKNNADYFANIVPRTGGLSSTSDLKPMSWQAVGGVAGGPASAGGTGYFGLTYATGAVTGYSANSMFYLRTDGSNHTQFGEMIPALTGASTDKIDLTNAVGSFGVGGYTTLAYSPVAFGGYPANQFYYLRLDSVTGNTILGRINPSLVPGTRIIHDIANLGGVFNTLNYAFDATGPAGVWGLNQLYATGGRSATSQSISFAAIADRAINLGAFTVAPSASSGLTLSLTVVAGSTGAAQISGPVAGVFTVTPLAPGVITLQASQSGGAFDANSMRQSFNATGVAALVISTQPTAQSAVAGGTANFSVSASGTSTVSYQWRKAGANITGNASATTSTLTLTNVQSADAASYDVIVTNLSGSITSNPVTFTLTAASPVITNSPLTAGGTVGSGFSFSVTASGAPTSFSASPLPAGLSINTASGVITGSPTTAGTTSVVLGATNGGGTGNATLTVTISAAGVAPVITNSPLTAGGTVNTAFSFTITASGSPSSYAASPLPAGLAINTATGVISGTPTTAGTTSVLLGATNGTGTGNATLSITVGAAGVAPVITNSPLTAAGTIGTAFSFTTTATGSPTSYSASPLPAGLSVVTATGVITGTPTTAGVTSVTLGATNGNGTGTTTLTITVAAAGAAPIITNTPLSAAGTVGTAFNFTTTATGAPTSYNAAPLPAGLVRNTTTGTITGVPTTVGVTPVLLSATNANGTGNATLTITVGPAAGTPVLTSPTIATGSVGTPITPYGIDATGTPTVFSATGLPAGLSINSIGTITGTPTTIGTSLVTITAGNAFGTTTATLTFTIAASTVVPVVSSPTTAPGTSGTPFSYVVVAAPTPTSYSATGLPAGLVINSTTGVITGTPTVSGTFNVTVTTTNANGSSSFNLAITIAGATAVPILTSPTTASATAGTPFVTYLIAATGLPTSYAATGLPPGLTVNTLTGAITGTPTSPGNYAVTITATNSLGTSTATLTISVGPNLSSRIMNFSARAISGPGDQTLIMGFVVSGNNKNLLVRGVGPTLAAFGIITPLADPLLTLYNNTGLLATNDDWSTTSTGASQSTVIAATASQVGAFALPAGSKDSSLLFMVNNGAHTSGLVRPNSTTGVALTEIYDIDPTVGSRLVNVSARMHITGGEGTLIAGFSIGGSVAKTVLIRGIGPSLAQFGVSGVLPDPIIAVYSGSTQIYSNDNWEASTATAAQIVTASIAVGAFALPAGSKDAVLLITLQPGNYTVLVSGGTATGVALIEIYDTQ